MPAPSVAPIPAVAPVSAVSSVVAVAAADALVRGEALALPDADGTTTAPPDADALVLGDALADDEALVDVDGDEVPAAPDADGAGELVAGVPQAASTPSTSTNNMINEKRCFIRSVTPKQKTTIN